MVARVAGIVGSVAVAGVLAVAGTSISYGGGWGSRINDSRSKVWRAAMIVLHHKA